MEPAAEARSDTEGHTQARGPLIVACVAGGLLAAQIALFRLYGQSHRGEEAFLAVCIALLGVGGGGVAVFTRRRLNTLDPDILAARGCLVFSVGLPLVLFLTRAIGPIASSCLLCLPFLGGGLAPALMLDQQAKKAHVLCAAGAMGTSIASVVALVTMHTLGSWNILFLASALGAIAFLLCSGKRHRTQASFWLLLTTFLWLVPEASFRSSESEPDDTAPKSHRFSQPLIESLRPGARVLVLEQGPTPSPCEPSPTGSLGPQAPQPKGPITKPSYTHLRPHDVRSALVRENVAYDAVVIPGIGASEPPAAGLVWLSQDPAATLEALAAISRPLENNGLLFFTLPRAHLLKLLITLGATLGPQLGRHLIAWTEPRGCTAILVSRTPLSPKETTLAETFVRARKNAELITTPTRPGEEGPVKDFLDGLPTSTLAKTDRIRLDPATDDRPSFRRQLSLHQLSWSDLQYAFFQDTDRWEQDPAPSGLLLLVALVVVIILGAVLVLIPVATRQTKRNDVSTRRLLANLVYYGSTGAAFAGLKIALIISLGLLFGPPQLVFTTALAGFFLGAGAGAHQSQRLSRKVWATTLATVITLVLATSLEGLVQIFRPFAVDVRVAIGFLVALFSGIAAGMPFPAGLAFSRRRNIGLVAWGHAIYAVATVAGAALAHLLSVELGLSALLVVAAVCFAAARLVFPYLGE